jgi:thiamine transporter
MVEGAVIAAVAMGLSLIPIELPNAAFDLSLGLVPLAIFAVRRGFLPAVAAGLVWGLIHPLFGHAYIMSIPQFLFEYPFAFAFGGFFGLFAKPIRGALAHFEGGQARPQGAKTGQLLLWVALASIVATLARWFWHFLAGATVWAEYAPEGMNPWLYSLIMNGASFLANAVMLLVVVGALARTAPRLFRSWL